LRIAVGQSAREIGDAVPISVGAKSTSPVGENRSGSESRMSRPMTRGLASAILPTSSARIWRRQGQAP
jgi:hypothetical protein